MKKCAAAKKCGACSSLQIPYEEQLIRKQEYVQGLFLKQDVQMTKGMKDPYHYRHKIYASFYQDRYHHMHAGLYEENSHKHIDSSACLIQHVKANQILKTICDTADRMRIGAYIEDRRTGILRHAYIRVSSFNGDILLVIVIGSKELPGSKHFVSEITKKHPEIKTVILNYNHEQTSMILGRRDKVLYGRGYITDQIDGISFRISSRSFYQINPVQTEVLYKTALELADLKEDETVLDGCCGIGTISLLAARKAKHVTGVEISPEAIRDAKYNAAYNGIENVSFYAKDITSFLKNNRTAFDTVILDPPRSGMGESAMYSIRSMAPKKIVYVSCNPETQAEDLKILKKEYRIKTIIPVDMFPFTRHVECVVLMSNK